MPGLSPPDDELASSPNNCGSWTCFSGQLAGLGTNSFLKSFSPAAWMSMTVLMAQALEKIYLADVRPEWWKLPAMSQQAWDAVARTVEKHDPWCRGVLLQAEAAEEPPLDGLLHGGASTHLQRILPSAERSSALPRRPGLTVRWTMLVSLLM